MPVVYILQQLNERNKWFLTYYMYSAPDNYFANQYSTDENSAQLVPADFNWYHN